MTVTWLTIETIYHFLRNESFTNAVFFFITALVGTTGRDQEIAIFLLLLLLLLQTSNGPIRAKQIHRCSSLIGRQY